MSHPKGLESEHLAYYNARTRCLDPKNKDYRNYGGRGILFKFKSFKEFITEIGPKPDPKLVLDRIDNQGHYEPGNVRWNTQSANMLNRRTGNSTGAPGIYLCKRTGLYKVHTLDPATYIGYAKTLIAAKELQDDEIRRRSGLV